MNFKYKKKFDAIFSISVIEHVENWLDALINPGRLLSKDGFLSITYDFRKWRNRKLRGYVFTKKEIDCIIDELRKNNLILRGNDFVDKSSLIKHLKKRRYYTVGTLFFQNNR